MARVTLSRKPRVIRGFTPEQSAELFRMFLQNDNALRSVSDRDASARIYTSDLVTRAGQYLRASPPDSRGMALLLPAPESTEPGERVTVSLENPLGALRVSCVPNQGAGARVTLGTVNGLERATFTTAGEIVFSSNGATGWSTAAEHPAESAATPGITPIASTEINPENTSGSSWRWVLRPFSIVLGRLAKIPGLTVLGNAGAAVAAVDSVTASAARQALLSNAAGTGIGWRPIEAADLPAASPYGWDDVLATDPQSNGNDPTISAGDELHFASGSTGITAADEMTIASTGLMHLHPSGQLHLGHDLLTTEIHAAATGAIQVQSGLLLSLSSDTGSWATTSQITLQPGTFVSITTGYLEIGATGPTTNSPQIRSGDAAFRIAGTALTELSASTGQVRLNGGATGANAAISYLIGGVARWTIAGNGEWTTPAGTSGQFWKHNGAAFPVWATFALTDLPSQAADTFLGRLAGAGTPTAQLFSDIDSTSIIYDATSHTFQRAALTGDATASQNSNALTIANDAVTNAKMANMAQATIKLRASGAGTGDPTDGTITEALDMAGSTRGSLLERGAASWGVITPGTSGLPLVSQGAGADPTYTKITASGSLLGWDDVLANDATSGANNPLISSGQYLSFDVLTAGVPGTGDIRKTGALTARSATSVELMEVSSLNRIFVDDAGCVISGDNASGFVDIQSHGSVGTRLSSNGGSGAGHLRIIEDSASTPSLAAGEGMFWVRSVAPNEPWFTDDTNVDRPIQNSLAEKTAATAVTNATTVLACTGTYTIPANTLRVGSRFRVHFTYQFVRGATATALNLGSFINVGGAAISTALAAQTVAGTYHMRVMGEFTVLTTGAGGTAMATMVTWGSGTTVAAEGNARYAVNLALAINTTTTVAVSGTAQMNTAVASTTITATGGDIQQRA